MAMVFKTHCPYMYCGIRFADSHGGIFQRELAPDGVQGVRRTELENQRGFVAHCCALWERGEEREAVLFRQALV